MLTGAAEAHQHDGGGRDLAAVVPDSRAGDRQGRDAERRTVAAARGQEEGLAAPQVRSTEEPDERNYSQAEGPYRR